MIEKLADERVAGGDRGIVEVVGTQFGFGDQPDRTDLERVVGIQNPAGPTHFDERLTHLIRGSAVELVAIEESSEPTRPIGRCFQLQPSTTDHASGATAFTFVSMSAIATAATTVAVRSAPSRDCAGDTRREPDRRRTRPDPRDAEERSAARTSGLVCGLCGGLRRTGLFGGRGGLIGAGHWVHLSSLAQNVMEQSLSVQVQTIRKRT